MSAETIARDRRRSEREMQSQLGDALDRIVEIRLARVSSALTAQANRMLDHLAQLNLGEFRALFALSQLGRASMSQVAGIRGMDKGMTSRILSGLADQGLVAVAPDRRDSRKKVFHLTDAGHRVLDQVTGAMADRRTAVEQALGPGGAEALLDMLDRLEEAIALLDEG